MIMLRKTAMSSSFDPPSAGYGYARARDRAFAAVRDLWRVRKKAGLTQRELGERLGKQEGWVSRKLSGPSNWTLRTLGELSDALEGEVEINIVDLKAVDVKRSNFDAYACQGESPTTQRPFVSDDAGIDNNLVSTR